MQALAILILQALAIMAIVSNITFMFSGEILQNYRRGKSEDKCTEIAIIPHQQRAGADDQLDGEGG